MKERKESRREKEGEKKKKEKKEKEIEERQTRMEYVKITQEPVENVSHGQGRTMGVTK